jgi:hypothetical protein
VRLDLTTSMARRWPCSTTALGSLEQTNDRLSHVVERCFFGGIFDRGHGDGFGRVAGHGRARLGGGAGYSGSAMSVGDK